MYFFSLSIFESAILLSFSVLTVAENRNSSGQYVFQLNVFFYVSAVAELMERLYSWVVLLFTFYAKVVKSKH